MPPRRGQTALAFAAAAAAAAALCGACLAVADDVPEEPLPFFLPRRAGDSAPPDAEAAAAAHAGAALAVASVDIVLPWQPLPAAGRDSPAVGRTARLMHRSRLADALEAFSSPTVLGVKATVPETGEDFTGTMARLLLAGTGHRLCRGAMPPAACVAEKGVVADATRALCARRPNADTADDATLEAVAAAAGASTSDGKLACTCTPDQIVIVPVPTLGGSGTQARWQQVYPPVEAAAAAHEAPAAAALAAAAEDAVLTLVAPAGIAHNCSVVLFSPTHPFAGAESGSAAAGDGAGSSAAAVADADMWEVIMAPGDTVFLPQRAALVCDVAPRAQEAGLPPPPPLVAIAAHCTLDRRFAPLPLPPQPLLAMDEATLRLSLTPPHGSAARSRRGGKTGIAAASKLALPHLAGQLHAEERLGADFARHPAWNYAVAEPAGIPAAAVAAGHDNDAAASTATPDSTHFASQAVKQTTPANALRRIGTSDDGRPISDSDKRRHTARIAAATTLLPPLVTGVGSTASTAHFHVAGRGVTAGSGVEPSLELLEVLHAFSAPLRLAATSGRMPGDEALRSLQVLVAEGAQRLAALREQRAPPSASAPVASMLAAGLATYGALQLELALSLTGLVTMPPQAQASGNASDDGAASACRLSIGLFDDLLVMLTAKDPCTATIARPDLWDVDPDTQWSSGAGDVARREAFLVGTSFEANNLLDLAVRGVDIVGDFASLLPGRAAVPPLIAEAMLRTALRVDAAIAETAGSEGQHAVPANDSVQPRGSHIPRSLQLSWTAHAALTAASALLTEVGSTDSALDAALAYLRAHALDTASILHAQWAPGSVACNEQSGASDGSNDGCGVLAAWARRKDCAADAASASTSTSASGAATRCHFVHDLVLDAAMHEATAGAAALAAGCVGSASQLGNGSACEDGHVLGWTAVLLDLASGLASKGASAHRTGRDTGDAAATIVSIPIAALAGETAVEALGVALAANRTLIHRSADSSQCCAIAGGELRAVRVTLPPDRCIGSDGSDPCNTARVRLLSVATAVAAAGSAALSTSAGAAASLAAVMAAGIEARLWRSLHLAAPPLTEASNGSTGKQGTSATRALLQWVVALASSPIAATISAPLPADWASSYPPARTSHSPCALLSGIQATTMAEGLAVDLALARASCLPTHQPTLTPRLPALTAAPQWAPPSASAYVGTPDDICARSTAERAAHNASLAAALLEEPAMWLERVHEDPAIVLVHNFLSRAECEHVMLLSCGRVARSTVASLSGSAVDRVRTSSTLFFAGSETDIIRRIEQRAVTVTGSPRDNLETLQIVRYQPGQLYKAHYDWFDDGSNAYQREMLQWGGQRAITLFVYLSPAALDGVTGQPIGGTEFPLLNMTVRPPQGTAVFWHDTHPNGTADSRTLHGGTPPAGVTKYGLNVWLRERSRYVDIYA